MLSKVKISLTYITATLAVASLQAQVGTATLSGTVNDPSGAVVANANISLESTERKFSRQAETDTLGNYMFTALPPGNYKLVVDAAGFRKEEITDVSLSSGQASTLNVSMKLLATSGQVTVNEAPPLLQTTAATVGSEVQAQQVTQLPLLGGNITRAMLIVPGVSPIDASDTYNRSVASLAINPAFYGQRQRDNYYTLDGMGDKDPLFQDINVTPPQEAIAEMKIESGMTSGAYGRASGANINIVTKSGTNAYHGALWEDLRNNVMNARSFFTPTLGPYKWNQFGIAGGGPLMLPKLISKEKAWYFYGYYEGIRIRSTSTATSLVPTAAELNGDFSGDAPIFNPYTTTTLANGTLSRQPFPNNQIPSNLLNQPGLTIMKALLPLPNYPAGIIPGTNWINPAASSRTNSDQWDTRIDHQFGSKNNFYGRYSDHAWGQTSTTFPALPNVRNDRNANVVLSDTEVFNPTFLVTGRFGFSRMNETVVTPPIAGLASSAGTLSAWEPFRGQQVIPPITIPGYPGLSQGISIYGPEYEWNGMIDSQKILGRHTIDFGGSVVRTTFLTDNQTGRNVIYSTSPTSNFVANTGSGLASFVLGLPDSAGRIAGSTAGDMYGNGYSLYVHDTFRYNNRLTLNFGLRWDFAAPMLNRDGSGTFVFETGQYVWDIKNPITGAPANIRRGGIDPDYHNYQPRVGLAYQFNEKTVVRSSFGIFDDTFGVNYAQTQQGNRGNWPFAFPQTVTGLNATTPNAIFPNVFPGPAAGSAVPLGCQQCLNVFHDSSRTPYVMEWTFSLQRQLTPSLMAEAVYFGSHGVRVSGQMLDNTAALPGPGPISARTQNPQFPSYIVNGYNEYNSYYDGLSIKLDKRFSHGLVIDGNFTWSKTIDQSDSLASGGGAVNQPWSNPTRYNLAQFRGPAGYDIPLRLVLSGIYEIPGKTSSRVANAVLANWSVSAIASFDNGVPYTVFLSSDNENIGPPAGRYTEFPNLVGKPNAIGNRSVFQWFNTAAFALPAPYTLGNAGRNILRAQPLRNVDFSLFKKWPFLESRDIELRGEFFDLSNTTTFSTPNSLLGTAVFGTVTATRNSGRQVQLALKLHF
ncbi:MAG TPA: carboxypeptidase regulatory-like domain-containing protein [Bryobacteraceae bacterium]|nr:carboxypeptidase regulatory-like domain-containing protein [Bryobacteraceae bacterium]